MLLLIGHFISGFIASYVFFNYCLSEFKKFSLFDLIVAVGILLLGYFSFGMLLLILIIAKGDKIILIKEK